MSLEISAVVITKNEVDRIAKCIQSLLLLTDDVIVIDSGSNDNTINIAKELGVQVYESEWLGYGRTKNFGHTKAKHDWVLSIDADESLSSELIQEIKGLSLELGTVYAIDRQNYYFGKKIKHSGWSPDWVHRIFNKKEIRWNDNLVHEKLIIPDNFKVKKLRHKLNHDSYRSIDDHKSKIERYAELRAQIWMDRGRQPGFLKRTFGPFFKGFKSYVLKLGFMDGREGWIIAKMNYHLVKRQIHYFDHLKKSHS